MTFHKKENPKDKQMLVRVSSADKALIEAEAHQANLSVSEFMMRRALARKITSHSDEHLINEMRQSIAALREMYFSGTPVKDERLRPALDAVANAMHRVIGRKKRGA